MSFPSLARWAVPVLACSRSSRSAPSLLGPAAAQDSELLYRVVAPESASEGDADIVVEIRAENAENLGAFGFQLTYDPDVLELAVDQARATADPARRLPRLQRPRGRVPGAGRAVGRAPHELQHAAHGAGRRRRRRHAGDADLRRRRIGHDRPDPRPRRRRTSRTPRRSARSPSSRRRST